MIKVILALSVWFPNTDHVTTTGISTYVSSNYVIDMPILFVHVHLVYETMKANT